jgi:TPR repeat protein
MGFVGVMTAKVTLNSATGKRLDTRNIRFAWSKPEFYSAPSAGQTEPTLGDRQDATVSSSPPVLAVERDLEKAAVAVSPSLASSQVGREKAVVRPMFPTAQKQVDREQPVAGSSLPAFAQRQLDGEEVTVLLKRGKDLIADGDIAAARLILKRAADANNAEAALALAATYDPFVLRELKVYGFTPDAAMARVWYEKATELGSPAAPRRLEMLTQGSGAR